MSEVPIEERFSKNFKDFCRLILEIVSNAHAAKETDIPLKYFEVVNQVVDKIDKNALLDIFIKGSCKHWHLAHEGKKIPRTFIGDNWGLLMKDLPVPEENATKFKDLFLKTKKLSDSKDNKHSKDSKGEDFVVPDGDVNACVDYLIALIKISIKRIYYHRQTNSNYFPDVDIEAHIKSFNIKLNI